MTTKIKKPRKGSGRWLAWHVSSNGELTAYRENSAMPWKYTLKTKDPETGIREHVVTAALIARLTERRILTGHLVQDGRDAWNRITYTLGPVCDLYCDGDED